MRLIVPILFLGLMASLSPSTLVVFILVLGTARARVNAAAFLIGWGISLTIVFTASYALGASDTTQRESGRTAVAIVEILLGVALVVVGARQWRRRDESSPASSTGWGSERLTGRMRSLNPLGAAVVGVLKQPWAITAAAAIVVVRHHTTPPATLIAFACFTFASTATVGLMYLYYTRSPGEAQAYVAALQARVIAAGPAVLAVAALLVGSLLAIDGLIGLA